MLYSQAWSEKKKKGKEKQKPQQEMMVLYDNLFQKHT
jgi:hypothetical protein